MFERDEWESLERKTINSPETMIDAIKKAGIIPFFKVGIPGWSIEEQTAPGFWFWEEEDNLGPWDWKIDAVRTGEIAYGKFLGGKAAFATVEFYRELMNWRRSLPKYRIALGENNPVAGLVTENGRAATKSGKTNTQGKSTKGKAVPCSLKLTSGERVMHTLSPIVLDAIREGGTMEMKELRQLCIGKVGHRIPGTQIDIKKNIMDSVMSFLQMGTWSVIGDITRVYRGPNLTYNGWQRTSNTTPDALFRLEGIGLPGAGAGGMIEGESSAIGGKMVEGAPCAGVGGRIGGVPGAGKKGRGARPFWADIIEPEEETMQPQRTPEESRELLISHVESLYPGASRKVLERTI